MKLLRITHVATQTIITKLANGRPHGPVWHRPSTAVSAGVFQTRVSTGASVTFTELLGYSKTLPVS